MIKLINKAFGLLNIIRSKYNRIYNSYILKKNDVIIGSKWQIKGRMMIENYGTIKIGDSFIANSSASANPIGGDTIARLIVTKDAMISIGSNVGFSNSTIVCYNKVVIGNYVYIGGGCKIWDTDFHSLNPFERIHNGDNKVITSPISIGDYAFIGGSSIILKGITIGKNSIIGAGSVVTKSVPENEIWAGNPAKFIRKNE